MLENSLAKIAETFADHRNQKSSWGRWAGSVIITVFLFNWTYVCTKTGVWVPIDMFSALIIISIYGFLAIKSVMETTKAAAPLAETPPPTPLLSKDDAALLCRVIDLGAEEDLIRDFEARLRTT